LKYLIPYKITVIQTDEEATALEGADDESGFEKHFDESIDTAMAS
jgi:hypothetical protein